MLGERAAEVRLKTGKAIKLSFAEQLHDCRKAICDAFCTDENCLLPETVGENLVESNCFSLIRNLFHLEF